MNAIRFISNKPLRLLTLMLCLAASVSQLHADTYTVAGNDTQALGTSWSQNATSNDMTQASGDRYYLLKTVTYPSATSYEFKITVNHSWDVSYGLDGGSQNAAYSVNAGTGYILFGFNATTHMPHVVSSLHSVVIAGDDTQALGNSTWDAANTGNAMTTTDGITYTLTKQVEYATGGTMQCKAVSDGRFWLGDNNGNNVQYTIGNGGNYVVTYTLNAATGILTVNAHQPVTYYVVGDSTNLFPNGWGIDPTTAMTDNNNGTYTWTMQNVHLYTGSYPYKVYGSDSSWHPSGANQAFDIHVPGNYTLTVNYDSNTGTVTATTTLIAADPINAVYVIGNVGSQQWAANAGIPMEYNDFTGYYEKRYAVFTANSHFALATTLGSNSEDWATLNANRLSSTGNSHWAINSNWLGQWLGTQPYQDDNHNWYVEQSGAYDIAFNPSTREVRVTPSFDHLYISSGVNWTYENNSVEMTTVDGNVFHATVTLTNGDYFLFSTALSDQTALGATDPSYEISNLRIGFAQRLQSGTNNFHFTGATGKYIVVVNIEKNTVTLRKTADATVTKIYLLKSDRWTPDPAGGTYNGQTLAGKRGGIYAWNKLNLEDAGGNTYQMATDGPTNYTYENEVENYGGNNYLKDLPDTITGDGKQWHAWSVSNSICEFYFIRNINIPGYDAKSQKIMRRAGEVWLMWLDKDATSNRQDDAVMCDSLMDVTSMYYNVTASGVSDCSSMLEDHYYVYYTNTTGWDSVYCYAWRDGESLIRFTDVYPGSKCTFVGYDDDGYEVWCYDFGLMEDFHRIYGTDENGEYIIPTGIIFDNGMNEDNSRQQTGDLPFDNGACYDYLGMVYLGNSLGGIINNGIVNGPKYTVEDDLIGVYYDENALTRIYETDITGNYVLDEQGKPKYIDVKGALYAKDFNNYTAKSKMFDGSTDYVYDICAHTATDTYPGGSQIQIMRDYYDQSNWVKIVLSPNFDNTHLQNTGVTYDKDLFDDEDFESATDENRIEPYLAQYVDKIIPGGSMSGNLVNNVNPQMHITNIAMPVETDEPYEKNVYVTGHFNDTVVFTYVHQDWNPGVYNGVYRTVPHMATNQNGETYVDHVTVDQSKLYKMFYVAPKPQEIAYITWAVFDHPNHSLPLGTPLCTTEPDEPGAFYAPMNWNRTGQLWDGDNPDDEAAPWGTTYGPYSNGFMQYGAFQVNWSLFEGMELPVENTNRPQKPWYQIFKPGQAYKILALIRYSHGMLFDDVEYQAGVYDNDYDDYNDGPDHADHVCNAPRRSNYTWGDMERVPYDNLDMSKFIVFPLLGSDEDSNGNDLGNVTAVKEVETTPTVVSKRYYNLTGVSSDKPFDGINIIVTTYSDGTCTSHKVLR